MRKVIQISAVETKYSGIALIALCDDGTMWENYNPTSFNPCWNKISDIPQEPKYTISPINGKEKGIEIHQISSTNEDGSACLELKINGETFFDFSDSMATDATEDICLNRDMNFLYKIPDLLMMAYEAGVNMEGIGIVKGGKI